MTGHFEQESNAITREEKLGAESGQRSILAGISVAHMTDKYFKCKVNDRHI